MTVKGTQTIYGMHAVRVHARAPSAPRVVSVRLAEQREDPRARAIEELARRQRARWNASTARALSSSG